MGTILRLATETRSASTIRASFVEPATRQTMRRVLAAPEDQATFFTWGGFDIPDLFVEYQAKHGALPNFATFGGSEEALVKLTELRKRGIIETSGRSRIGILDMAALTEAAHRAGALALWLSAGLAAGGGLLLALLVIPGALLAWQVRTLQMGNPADALRKFRSNHWVGISVTLVFLAEALRMGLATAT